MDSIFTLSVLNFFTGLFVRINLAGFLSFSWLHIFRHPFHQSWSNISSIVFLIFSVFLFSALRGWCWVRLSFIVFLFRFFILTAVVTFAGHQGFLGSVRESYGESRGIKGIGWKLLKICQLRLDLEEFSRGLTGRTWDFQRILRRILENHGIRQITKDFFNKNRF